LSRKADYALLILSYLHDRPGTARAVADTFGLSRPFVANILKELCQLGFVASHRGVKGGYALARPARTITLAELLETLEDGVRLTICNPGAHDHDACSIAGTCTLKGPIAQVHGKLIEVLRGVTLADLFDARVEPAQPAALLGLTLVESPAIAKPSPA
jgi:Rrf2 family protein